MPLSVDQGTFRRACAKYVTGVTVATVIDDSGAPHGLTANSFTSVSLTPPLVLICVGHNSALLPHFRASRHFGINILDERQRELSVRFASKGNNRFAGLNWARGVTGVPLLPDVLGVLECARHDMIEAGDHAIILGEVVRACAHDGHPLAFFNSQYHALR